MKVEFIPIDFDYFDYKDKNYILLVGRTREGEKICVVDSYEANFWIILKNEYSGKAKEISKKIGGIEIKKATRITKILKMEVHQKKFLGRDVTAIRVFVTNHKDAHDVASEIGDMKEVEFRREYDIPILTKYIKEKKVEPLNWYTVEGNFLNENDFDSFLKPIDKKIIFADKIIKLKEEKILSPKVLSINVKASDNEIGKGSILMVSLHGEKFRKVLTWKKCKVKKDFIECFENEKEMLENFVQYVKDYDPDILAGYFSDNFDLPYLKEACKKNKIKFNIGIDGSEPSFFRGRVLSGKIFGVVHIDLSRFIDAVFSQYLQSETLSLSEVAKELTGVEGEKFDYLMKKDSDWNEFFSYGLSEVKLISILFGKIWADIFEFSRVIREPLFDVTRDRMSSHVENYIIHNIDRFNEIVEKRPVYEEIEDRKKHEKYEGGFVYEPVAGLYEKICVFDFTSMHASIIVTFNISRSTFLNEKTTGAFETPEFVLDGEKRKFYFSRQKGFSPELLGEIVRIRKKAKAEYKKNPNSLLKAKSNTYKLLANASYGYLGFFGARYYCRECAASTLAFVREYTNKTMEIIKNKGCKVIFSDTDSIGFIYNGMKKNEVLKILEDINKNLPGIMELELEDFYKRGIFVSKRTGRASPYLPSAKRTSKTGAKKKYAFIDEKDNIKIKGFETIRRDWSKYTRNLQSQILKVILEEGNEKKALKLLKESIDRLKKREVNVKELMIKTELRRPIEKYIATGPHVVAAKKMKEKNIPVSEGMLIEYFVGKNHTKSKKIGDRVFLPDEKADYDIDYYLNNQIIPSVENIFEIFGVNVNEIIKGEEQKKLF
ncbi:MAG: DNA-directed DNA polymerase [Nanoarchaeota archaeon]|nr:DNA-directed DNA polymerase [Nanoarchaeota archaeon]